MLAASTRLAHPDQSPSYLLVPAADDAVAVTVGRSPSDHLDGALGAAGAQPLTSPSYQIRSDPVGIGSTAERALGTAVSPDAGRTAETAHRSSTTPHPGHPDGRVRRRFWALSTVSAAAARPFAAGRAWTALECLEVSLPSGAALAMLPSLAGRMAEAAFGPRGLAAAQFHAPVRLAPGHGGPTRGPGRVRGLGSPPPPVVGPAPGLRRLGRADPRGRVPVGPSHKSVMTVGDRRPGLGERSSTSSFLWKCSSFQLSRPHPGPGPPEGQGLAVRCLPAGGRRRLIARSEFIPLCGGWFGEHRSLKIGRIPAAAEPGQNGPSCGVDRGAELLQVVRGDLFRSEERLG